MGVCLGRGEEEEEEEEGGGGGGDVVKKQFRNPFFKYVISKSERIK